MAKKRSKKEGLFGNIRVKRTISISTFATADKEDREYWWSQSPLARLRAGELIRRINYGAAATGRLQRLLEVVRPKTS